MDEEFREDGMLIKYKTIISEGYKDYKEYREISSKCCCAPMDNQYDYDGHFKFAPEFNEEPKIYGEFQGWGNAHYLPIDFCPFCGKPITCVEVEKYEKIYYKEKVEVCQDKFKLERIK